MSDSFELFPSENKKSYFQIKRKNNFRTLESKEDLYRLYKFGEKIGCGNFSVVKIATDRKTSEKWAIKIISKKDMGNNLLTLQNEINILTQVNHPNIISLREIFETKDKVYLVMEYCDGGDLFDDLLEEEFYDEEKAARIVFKILSVLKYLHSIEIAHRDLKPENLLLSGTPTYVAPEILDDKTSYGPKVDIWSVGVITYLLLCGYPPFYHESTRVLFKQIFFGEFYFPKEEWSNISKEAKDFISKMLIVDSEKRISVQEAICHPWILNYNDISNEYEQY